MKKFIALFLALVLALGLMACASSATTETTTQPAETTTTTEETKTEEAAPAEETSEETAPAAAGSVYWLNFKPESDEVLQKVAAMYTEKTGVPVTVVTAASGTYNETLTAEMDKSKMPTLFVVGNQAAVSTWGDYCYDLTGTPIANELTTDAYNLYDEDGKLCSIGYCYECYGIIVNKKLLEGRRLRHHRHLQLRDAQDRCRRHPRARCRARLRRFHLFFHELGFQLALHRSSGKPRVLLRVRR